MNGLTVAAVVFLFAVCAYTIKRWRDGLGWWTYTCERCGHQTRSHDRVWLHEHIAAHERIHARQDSPHPIRTRSWHAHPTHGDDAA